MTFADLFLKANPLLVAWVDFLFTLSVEVKKQGRVLAFNDRLFKILRPFLPEIENLSRESALAEVTHSDVKGFKAGRVISMAQVRVVSPPYFKKALRDALGFLLLLIVKAFHLWNRKKFYHLI